MTHLLMQGRECMPYIFIHMKWKAEYGALVILYAVMLCTYPVTKGTYGSGCKSNIKRQKARKRHNVMMFC